MSLFFAWSLPVLNFNRTFVRVNNSVATECLVARRLCLQKDNIMMKLAKTMCLGCMLLMAIPVDSLAGIKGGKNSQFDWNPVINAIIEVESEGNAMAVDKSGKSCGSMQITPVMVKECNRILSLRKSSLRYTMKDRFSVSKSKEMFLLYQSFYNPKNDVEMAIRSWNGGINYTKKGTQKYYLKVMSKMK